MYKPMAVDARTGLYATSTKVSPGEIRASKTQVNLDDFRAVLVIPHSNAYPSRLEFTLRRTMAELGYPRVLNLQEFRAWAADQKYDIPADKVTGETLKAFSTTVSPLLVVEINYTWLGNAQAFAGIRVVDGRNLDQLLVVSHPKSVWMSVDDEIIYPVLNEFRAWTQKARHQDT